MRNRTLATLAAATLFATAVALSAEEKGTGTLRGSEVNYVRVDDVRYVALDDAAGLVGVAVTSGNGVVNLEGAGKSVRLMPGKRVAIVDSGFLKFRGPVRSIGGKLYVPEDLLAEVYRAPLSGGKAEKGPEKPPETKGEPAPPDTLAPLIPAAGTVAVALTEEPERVVDVKLEPGDQSTNLLLDFDKATEKSIRVKKSDDGATLTITIPKLASTVPTTVLPVDNAYLSNVKFITSDDTVIIKLSAKGPVKVKAYNSGKTRLRIAIEPDRPAVEAINPELSATAEVAFGTTAVSIASGTTAEIDVAALKAGLDKIHAVIAIDPGHGGSDFGVSTEGRPAEKTVVLEVGRRLERLLTLADQKPYLTRSGDYFLKGDQRVALVTAKEPALLVSLHCNASLNEGSDLARGVDIYIFDAAADAGSPAPGAASGPAADAAIAKEVTEILAGTDRKTLTAKSRALAESIQAAIAAPESGLYSRGVKPADILFLRESETPGCHVELGFLTNPVDARSLEDPKIWDALAASLFQGIKNHLIARSAEAK